MVAGRREKLASLSRNTTAGGGRTTGRLARTKALCLIANPLDIRRPPMFSSICTAPCNSFVIESSLAGHPPAKIAPPLPTQSLTGVITRYELIGKAFRPNDCKFVLAIGEWIAREQDASVGCIEERLNYDCHPRTRLANLLDRLFDSENVECSEKTQVVTGLRFAPRILKNEELRIARRHFESAPRTRGTNS